MDGSIKGTKLKNPAKNAAIKLKSKSKILK